MMITCPCCHGKKVLLVYEDENDENPVPYRCGHCQGEGEIRQDMLEEEA